MSISEFSKRLSFEAEEPFDNVNSEEYVFTGLEMTNVSKNNNYGDTINSTVEKLKIGKGEGEGATENDDDEEIICSTSILRIASMWNKDHSLEEAIRVKWCANEDLKSRIDDAGRNEIVLSTLLEPDDIAPLFSGAEWAGTRVWDAALECIHYLYNRLEIEVGHSDEKVNKIRSRLRLMQGCTVLELGCGLGVPGMVFSMGMNAKHVVLTDQEQILNQLTKNVQSNFNTQEGSQIANGNVTSHSEERKIEAKSLFWSKENIRALLRDVNVEGRGFDYVINCDCVYEPLYGTSWNSLVECIDELLRIRPETIVLSSCERRNHDGVDGFIKAMELCEHVKAVVRVFVKDKVEIYETIGMYDGVESIT